MRPSFPIAIAVAGLAACSHGERQETVHPAVPPPGGLVARPPPPALPGVATVEAPAPAIPPPPESAPPYLASPDGAVLTALPPEVLADIRTELVRRGREDVAARLGELYDLQTGAVRDPAAAKAYEAQRKGVAP